MKRLLILAFLLCPALGWAAGGACPTGANYIDLTNPSNGGGLGSVTLASLGVTQCYYVSAAGLDSNSGTSESTPWLHAPGMANFTGSYTFAAGDGIIFRGGDTWHRSSGSPLTGAWTLTHSGTSANPVYFGIDLTWFSGGSFARPIFSQDNALSTGTVGSCSFADDGTTFLSAGSTSFNIVDGLEFTGNCQSGSGVGSIISPISATSFISERLYMHGWTSTAGVGDDAGVKIGTNGNSTSNHSNRHLFDVIDGADSTFGVSCNTPSCITSGTASGWAFGDGYDVEYSVIRHVSNGIQAGNICILIGNLMEYEFNPTLPGGRHGNNVEENFGSSCTTALFYNNVTQNTDNGVNWWPGGGTYYIFNNAWINSGHLFGNPAIDPNGLMLSGLGTTGFTTVHANLYNNTFQSNKVQAPAENSTTPGWAAGSTLTWENNHIMDFTNTTSFFSCGSGNSCAATENGGEVFQTTAVAQGQGYSFANSWTPTLASNATVGTGINATSFCAGLPNALAVAACESGSPKAVTEVADWGGFVAQYPAMTPIVRNTSAWDAGAYQIPPPSGPVPPQLPTTWVNNNEGNSGFAYELILGASSWTTGPPPTCSFSLPYAVSATGLQSAINAIEACRTLTGVGIALDIPPGFYSGSEGIIIPQSNSALSPNFLVLRSTLDSSLPNGRTVCSHGIQDNLATSTDPGIDNPDCAGDALTYQLGTTVTNVPAGPFTLGNGTSTNSSAYNDVQYMWTVETSGANKTAFQTCSPLGASGTSIPPLCAATTIAPDHWLIEDMEARMSVGNTSNDIIVAVQENGNETSLSQLPTHIHFRKVWVHGDWTSLATGANSVSGDFRLSCVYCSLVDSQISQSLRPGGEGHAFGAGWSQQLKVNHNWIEGSSSGYFSGGFSGAPSIPGLVPSVDVEIRRNRFTFPYSWLGTTDATCGTHGNGTVPHTNPTWGCTSSTGNSLVRKNSTEFKEAIRLLESGNIFENVDNSGGQGGILNDWNIRNNSSVTYAGGNNYQAVISDVTDQNNIRRNGCEGFGLDSSNAVLGNGGGVSFLLARALFSNELLYNVTNTNPGCVGVNSTGLLLASETLQWQGTVTENSAGTQAVFVANCSADLGGCPGQVASLAIGSVGTGCVNGNLIFSTPSTTTGTTAAGKYTCSGGALSTLTLTVPGSGYVSSAATATLTTGTGTVTVTMNSGATAPTTGFEYMDINPGDPVSISGCTAVTSFNVATHVVSGFTVPSGVGPAAVVGTNPTSLTVAYPWTTTGNSSDASGNCTLTKGQGGPLTLSIQHMTFVTDSVHAVSSGNIPSNGGPNFALNHNFANSIVLGGGWFNNSLGEGTATEKWNYDFTSMTADHMVWPTRTSSNYTAYCNHTAFPCGSPVMYFPTQSYCSGASPTSACVGFIGAMSASSMPLVLSDYHQFALITGSSFQAGAANQASDATDMGVHFSALDAAQTQNLFVCLTACGSSGPFPDALTVIPIVPAPYVGFGFTKNDPPPLFPKPTGVTK